MSRKGVSGVVGMEEDWGEGREKSLRKEFFSRYFLN